MIADAILPEIDGFTLANWVKSGSLAGPVILMLSAVERHTAAVRCKEAGVLCLEKPVAPDDLLTAIGKVLGINGETVPARRPACGIGGCRLRGDSCTFSWPRTRSPIRS